MASYENIKQKINEFVKYFKIIGIILLILAVPLIFVGLASLVGMPETYFKIFQLVVFVGAVIGLYYVQQDISVFVSTIFESDYDTIWYGIGLISISGFLIQLIVSVWTKDFSLSPDFVYPIVLAIIYLPIYFSLKYEKEKLPIILGSLWGGLTFIAGLIASFEALQPSNHNSESASSVLVGILYVIFAYGFVVFIVLSVFYLVDNINYGIDKFNNFLIL